MSTARHRVVVVGAALRAAAVKALKRAPVEVTVVDRIDARRSSARSTA
jgi:hypothetical protein